MLVDKFDIDPFKIFDIEPKFDIENLDQVYFKLYKTKKDIEILNAAYNILKDKFMRAQILCAINGENIPDTQLPKEMFNIMCMNLEEKKLLLNQAQNQAQEEIFANAKIANWAKTWYWLQKYSYLAKIIENS